jgi:CheY-like chemotaxis protein
MASKHVLIVDDSMELGRFFRSALLTLDPSLEVIVIPSAEEAILEVNRQPVELLIADIRLPGITGIQLIERLRSAPVHPHFILITGLKEADVKEQVDRLGVDAFFTKPVGMEPFLDAVRSCLYGAGVQDQGTAQRTPAGGPAAPPADGNDLPGVLAGLRQNLNAACVVLLDDLGHAAGTAGGIPVDDFEENWVPALMAALSANSRVSRLISPHPPEGLLSFRGVDYDLLLLPIGSFALIVFLHTGRTILRIALAIEETLAARSALAQILEQMGVPLQSTLPAIEGIPLQAVEPSHPLEDEGALAGLEHLLKQGGQALSPGDVQAFWDQAAGQAAQQQGASDVLSYDQARQLGLAPQDPESGES